MKKLIWILITISLLTACAKQAPDPFKGMRGKSASTLFILGEKALAEGRYEEAVKNFEALEGLYPFGAHSEQAQLDIIYAYHKNGDDELAIVAADRYIRLYPNGRYVDYAYYMRGYIGLTSGGSGLKKIFPTDPASRDEDKLKKAFAAFQTLAETFPHSPYTPSAIKNMVLIRNLLAKHEVLVADFYMERDAYLAAINRASVVVQDYQGTRSVPHALVILVRAYQALKLPQEAQKAYNLLRVNYPDTPEFINLNSELVKGVRR